MLGNIRRIFARRESAASASGPAVGAVFQAVRLRRLWWAAILLLGVSASAVAWTIWQLRTDAISAAVSETGNIASVLAGQLSRSLKSIDTALLEIKRSVEAQGIDSPPTFRTVVDQREFPETLARSLARLPQVFGIAIADREGQIIISTAGPTATRFNVAGRDFFWKARDRRGGQLIASVPSITPINDQETILVSPRLQGPHRGVFGNLLA